MKKFLLSFFTVYLISNMAFASTECEIVGTLRILREVVCERSIGSVYHPNGSYAGSKGGSWYHRNGAYAGSGGGSWYHSNGTYAGSSGGSWYHSNGAYAGNNGSSWYYSNGKYAGSNGSTWYDSDGSYLGVFSGLSEMEQLGMVLE